MNSDHPSETPGDSADALERLIRAAGRREEPPAQAYDQALRAATQAWQAKVHKRRRWITASIAASLLVTFVGTWLITSEWRGAAEPIAQFDRVIGTVQLRSKDGGWITVSDDTTQLARGIALRTREGSRAGLLLADNISLRLADATEIALESATRVRLVGGKLYLDTGAAARSIEVITAAGTAVDIGTQFEVAYRDDTYRLRVREGAVLLRRGSAQFRSGAGEQLMIEADGDVRRTAVGAEDGEWEWAQSLAPAPAIDGQPVTVLLEWVARETGRTLKYADAETQRKAARTILHGTIRHLAPLEALAVMLATTDLEYALLDDGSIRIATQEPR